MTFEFDFILVGLMQIFGFFVQGCTGFGCTVIAASVTNGLRALWHAPHDSVFILFGSEGAA